jgi:SAM-dependent methyltransferase
LGDLSELAPQEQQMLLGVIRLTLHQAIDLLDNPAAQPGWNYTDPVILEGYGRASASVPPIIAAAHPDLANVTSFLDVGTGVGLLAVSASNVWPSATVVGIDKWDASLARARANVDQAGRADRITLRQTDLESLTDESAYDCIWIPTFFLTEDVLEAGLTAAVRALRPGGWITLGRIPAGPDPVDDAVDRLFNIRAGGTSLDGKRALELLEAAGCTEVHVAPRNAPGPLELTLGQRPR